MAFRQRIVSQEMISLTFRKHAWYAQYALYVYARDAVKPMISSLCRFYLFVLVLGRFSTFFWRLGSAFGSHGVRNFWLLIKSLSRSLIQKIPFSNSPYQLLGRFYMYLYSLFPQVFGTRGKSKTLSLVFLRCCQSVVGFIFFICIYIYI